MSSSLEYLLNRTVTKVVPGIEGEEGALEVSVEYQGEHIGWD